MCICTGIIETTAAVSAAILIYKKKKNEHNKIYNTMDKKRIKRNVGLLSIFLCLIFNLNVNAQDTLELPEDNVKELKRGFKSKKFFNDIFKYSTFYGTYSQTNSIQGNQTFYVTQENELIETTERTPSDFMVTYGWRKLANFQYEDKNRFYRGDEWNATTKSNIGNHKGLEYLIQYDRGRQQGEDFTNKEIFVRYLDKWWFIKGEFKQNELVDLNYISGEVRARIPIGRKLSISIGTIYRTYDKAYGHNPIQNYLEDNQWWTLAYDYAGHTDNLYQMINPSNGQSMGYDYQWFNQDGELIASSDLDYRNGVFQHVVNQYNEEQLSSIGDYSQVSAIAGVDFYHYRDKFWLHLYGNILPYHKLLTGDERYSYNSLEGDDWIDYSAGGVIGVTIGKRLGIYGEINVQRYWDRDIRVIKAGLNYKL
ncbi:MAG: hypothetical protein Unbinned5607contig1000_44 [Prokaryotic dsDNA virus sp.]|nr:MAG: hypothetical protein Unbinned5607contig1000_44 [Prokaryotic dsDNA virus sp.]